MFSIKNFNEHILKKYLKSNLSSTLSGLETLSVVESVIGAPVFPDCV